MKIKKLTYYNYSHMISDKVYSQFWNHIQSSFHKDILDLVREKVSTKIWNQVYDQIGLRVIRHIEEDTLK